jgi:hypothetical protein
MSAAQLEDARAILGDDLLGPEEVATVFGDNPATVSALATPFTREQLAAAQRASEMLVRRVTHDGRGVALTLSRLITLFPDAFDKKLLRQMGYQLRDDWGIELEPLAATDTAAPGWALVRKEILDGSTNLTYDEQDQVIALYAQRLDLRAGELRRRTAVEAVYDTILYAGARQRRLLERTWDWCASRTIDGGYLNVGGFTTRGLQVLSFSTGVRHGALGVCPTRTIG